MTRWVLLTTFRPAAGPAAVREWLSETRALATAAPLQVTASDAAENLPGSVGGSGAVWDLRTPGRELPREGPIAAHLGARCLHTVQALALRTVASGYRALDGRRIKRTLALTVRAGTPEDVVHRFEASLCAMPEHITEIHSWALSRVRPGATSGGWTHVWEQEFAELRGLRVSYMQHPYHWAGVDRWFDPEMPCAIVEPRLAHTFRWAEHPVLTADPSSGG